MRTFFLALMVACSVAGCASPGFFTNPQPADTFENGYSGTSE